MLRRLKSSALVWSYATTVLRFGGLFLVLPVVLRTVPQEQLGLFYLFQSFSVISALLDAGIGPTVGRSVSFAWAGAERLERRSHQLIDPSTVSGPNWDLLRRILRTFSRFYLFGAFLLLIVLGFGCLPFIWKATAGLSDPAQGRWIWMFLVVASAWNFASSIWPSMLGGMNRVRDQQVAQLVSILAGYVTTVVGLMAGWQLWALALSGFVQAVVLRTVARRVCLAVADGEFKNLPGKFDRDLFATIWPASWRTGVLWASVSAYLSLPVFLTTTFRGLDDAARIGLAVQLAMTVGQVASAATLVKLPQFSIMKVRGESEQLLALFCERMVAYVLLFVAGSVAVTVLGDWLLHSVIGSKTALPPTASLILLLVWAGTEGFQSAFRGIALSANDTSVWRPVVIGTPVIAGVSLASIPLGTPWWLCCMLVAKWLALDIPVIRAGMRSLGAGPSAIFGAVMQVPSRFVQQVKSSR